MDLSKYGYFAVVISCELVTKVVGKGSGLLSKTPQNWMMETHIHTNYCFTFPPICDDDSLNDLHRHHHLMKHLAEVLWRKCKVNIISGDKQVIPQTAASTHLV